MASTDDSNFLKTAGSNLWDLALDYGRSKLIDVEAPSSDQNIPDTNDLVNGNPQLAASDALGGTYQNQVGGMSVKTWGLMLLGGVVGLVVLKKAKVL